MSDIKLSAQCPWPGLVSYSGEDQAFFHGRSEEINRIAECLDSSTLACLYGPSGVGKSSILQAGVGNYLRSQGGFPIFVLLDHGPQAGSFTSQIASRVITEARSAHTEIVEVAPRADIADEETLWEFFHRHEFWSPRNEHLKPILILDQFEELFTLSLDSERTSRLIHELGDLAENSPPAVLQETLRSTNTRLPYPIDTVEYRILVSLREDFLAHLESATSGIPAFKRNRFALLPLRGAQALDIVRIPGKHVVADGVAEAIVEAVTNSSDVRGNQNLPLEARIVSPPLLSLMCRELNEQRITSNSEQITVELVEQQEKHILHAFYVASMALVPPSTAACIEDKLLSPSGHRIPCAIENLLAEKILQSDIDTLVKEGRILRIEERGGLSFVEFSHDILTTEASKSREERMTQRKTQECEQSLCAQLEVDQRQRLQKKKLWATQIALLVVIALFAGLSWLVYILYFQVQHDDFSTVVKRYGFYEGRRELTEEEIRNRWVHYELSRHGRFHLPFQKGVHSHSIMVAFQSTFFSPKPYEEMRALDPNGNLTTEHSISTYLSSDLNGDDTTTYMKSVLQQFGEVCQWRVYANAEGLPTSERALDKNGKIIFNLLYVNQADSDSFHIALCQFYDRKGLPFRPLLSGFTLFRLTFDQNGYEVLRATLDSNENQAPNKWGASALTMTYDASGFKVREVSLDPFGVPTIDKYGISERNFYYDNNGNLTMYKSNAPHGAVMVKYSFDMYGNLTTSRLFDQREIPIADSSHTHLTTSRYEHGRSVENHHYRIDGRTLNDDSAVGLWGTILSHYDSIGRLHSREWIDATGKVRLRTLDGANKQNAIGVAGRPIWGS